jgi:hypothetical protein
MSEHWKHRATRCAVEGCERTRRKGWTTCGLLAHYELGQSLYGLGPHNEPIRAPVKVAEPTTLPDVSDEGC